MKLVLNVADGLVLTSLVHSRFIDISLFSTLMDMESRADKDGIPSSFLKDL
jgi:hypothetical protein